MVEEIDIFSRYWPFTDAGLALIIALCIFAIFSTSDKYQCIFDKISYMECHTCKKLVSNVLHMDKLICETCIKTGY